MGKDLDNIFAGMGSFEPCKAQEDPLDVLRKTTINNMHAFVLLAVSRMLKDGDVRLEAPKGSRASEELIASLAENLPDVLKHIAKEFLKK